MVKTDDEQFCCCEYVNEKKERTSLLACCCDCEAVDDACDRVMRCGELENSHWDRMWNTVSDRLRLPWYGGAVQARLDIVLPVLVVPTAIVVATSSPTATNVVLVILPVLMFILYQCWRRRQKSYRSQFFFSWTMTSVCAVIYVFGYTILVQREVFMWECMLLLTFTLITFYCLYLTKLGPGIIRAQRRRRNRRKRLKHNGGQNGFLKHSDSQEHSAYENKPLNCYETRLRTLSSGDGLREDEVTWVDSRNFKDGQLVTWCNICNVNMPARSHHCSVCNVCISERDHHCVWIDQCIGERNHVPFFVGLLFFLITTIYSLQLTLTSVCTPEMYLDWFLFPADCRFVYVDFPSAITWVCVCYSLLPTSLVIVIFIQQIITISQNITLIELHHASLRGWTRLGLFARNNINNQGLMLNWKYFFKAKRAKPNKGRNDVV